MNSAIKQKGFIEVVPIIITLAAVLTILASLHIFLKKEYVITIFNNFFLEEMDRKIVERGHIEDILNEKSYEERLDINSKYKVSFTRDFFYNLIELEIFSQESYMKESYFYTIGNNHLIFTDKDLYSEHKEVKGGIIPLEEKKDIEYIAEAIYAQATKNK